MKNTVHDLVTTIWSVNQTNEKHFVPDFLHACNNQMTEPYNNNNNNNNN